MSEWLVKSAKVVQARGRSCAKTPSTPQKKYYNTDRFTQYIVFITIYHATQYILYILILVCTVEGPLFGYAMNSSKCNDKMSFLSVKLCIYQSVLINLCINNMTLRLRIINAKFKSALQQSYLNLRISRAHKIGLLHMHYLYSESVKSCFFN